jgi:hypothetical protein
MLVEATSQYKAAVDILKERERGMIDYYASDLADMAVYLVNCWLMLKDGRISERKQELARLYIEEHLAQVLRAKQAILNIDSLAIHLKSSIVSTT